MPDFTARSVTRATVSPVIVRACVACGGKREIGKPCALCGLEDPPVTHDLGVQSYYHRSLVRRLAWALVGQHLAARRAKRASRYVTG